MLLYMYLFSEGGGSVARNLVLRAGCGIWLYQFLIIAYPFTLVIFRPWYACSGCGMCGLFSGFVLLCCVLFVCLFACLLVCLCVCLFVLICFVLFCFGGGVHSSFTYLSGSHSFPPSLRGQFDFSTILGRKTRTQSIRRTSWKTRLCPTM